MRRQNQTYNPDCDFNPDQIDLDEAIAKGELTKDGDVPAQQTADSGFGGDENGGPGAEAPACESCGNTLTSYDPHPLTDGDPLLCRRCV